MSFLCQGSVRNQQRRGFAKNMLSAMTQQGKPSRNNPASVGPNHQNQPKEDIEVSRWMELSIAECQ